MLILRFIYFIVYYYSNHFQFLFACDHECVSHGRERERQRKGECFTQNKENEIFLYVAEEAEAAAPLTISN